MRFPLRLSRYLYIYICTLAVRQPAWETSSPQESDRRLLQEGNSTTSVQISVSGKGSYHCWMALGEPRGVARRGMERGWERECWALPVPTDTHRCCRCRSNAVRSVAVFSVAWRWQTEGVCWQTGLSQVTGKQLLQGKKPQARPGCPSAGEQLWAGENPCHHLGPAKLQVCQGKTDSKQGCKPC